MPNNDVANARINTYWEKWGMWIAVVLLSLCAWTFLEQKARIDKLQTDVQNLYIDKVSKEDMKEFEVRVTRQVEGVKGDILSRLDFYFAKPKQ